MQRIILDTDLAMGAIGSEIDDGFALALICADPSLQLELVTTVNGNIDVESATLLTLELLQRLGRPEVPVVKGSAAPITRPDRLVGPPAEVVEKYGHRAPAEGYAAVELVRRVMASPGEITVVAIGPLTNLAAAIALEPGFAGAVKEIVIMGGVFLGHTHRASMPGEFNTWVDPESADAVLRSGAALRWVGLDVTLQVRLTTAHAQQMLDGAGSFGHFAGESTLAWIDRQRGENPGDAAQADSCAMHDPLAVAVLTDDSLVTWRPAHVSVVTGDGVARGVMVTDLLESRDAPPANCSIAVDVDVDAFTEMFLGAITRI